jgi:hypothetical protein
VQAGICMIPLSSGVAFLRSPCISLKQAYIDGIPLQVTRLTNAPSMSRQIR